MLDPKTMKYTFIDTCFGTHHPQFGYDADNTLWLSGTGQVAGWVNTRVFEETGDAARAQGWSPFVLDTNGNGRRDEYVEPNQPIDPRRTSASFPARAVRVMPSPVDGSIWYTVGVFGGTPGFLRFDPKTQLSEVYHRAGAGLRHPRRRHRQERRAVGSGSSGHLVELRPAQVQGAAERSEGDRRSLPRGLVVLSVPGPGFRGLGENSAESSYYTWVDQHNTLGLGENVPMSTANLNDGFVALKDGKMILLRIPYPLGFYAKGFDGRIDDPNAGWKGRGLWSTSGDRTPWLMEGGKGSKPRAVISSCARIRSHDKQNPFHSESPASRERRAFCFSIAHG
jgi:hypothetical protein